MKLLLGLARQMKLNKYTQYLHYVICSSVSGFSILQDHRKPLHYLYTATSAINAPFVYKHDKVATKS